jgi:hypothetical protein
MEPAGRGQVGDDPFTIRVQEMQAARRSWIVVRRQGFLISDQVRAMVKSQVLG